ncbi:MAG TPA: branched-chain amino acid ABC transporter permease [Ramlibacter sp.]|nr:branched-chain amino acid ABC transporter permease [Ramlibacter sp.]
MRPVQRSMDVRRKLSTAQIVGLIVLVVIACALPFVLGNYRIFQLTMAMSYAIALLGLNILTGYNGQISLGHGAFFAIGAYTAAVLMNSADWPYWATIPMAGIVCLVIGFLFGLPALRLEGLYLAVATLALGTAIPQILKHKSIEHWTGGAMGVVIIKPDPPAGIPLNQDQWLYFFVLAWVIVLFIAAWNLLRGRVGRALVAIRDQPIAAQAMGVNTALYKSLTFGVSALYTGIAGALASIAVQFASPDSFGVFLSLTLLIGIVVGGLASISGAFYGALFVQFVPNIADQISKAAPWAIYGVFLIAFMYLMPSGVAGLIAIVRRRLVPLSLMERKQDVHESTQDPGDRRGDVGRALPEHGVRPGEKGSEARANHAL